MKMRISVFYCIFIAVLVFTIGVFIYSNSTHPVEHSTGEIVDLDGKWIIERLSAQTGASGYSTVIEPINGADKFIFYSQNTPIRVYLDNQLVYKYEEYDIFYGETPSSRWHFVSLPKITEGSKLEVQGGVNGNPIVESYYGSSRSFFAYMLKSNWLGLVVCAVLLFGGLTLMILHAVFHKAFSRRQSLKYMGFFAFVSAFAIIFDSGLLSLIFSNAGLIEMFTSILYMLVVIPLLLYVEDDLYPGKLRVFIRIAAGAYLAWFITACVLNFTASRYFHYMRTEMNIAIAVVYGCIIIAAAINSASKEKFAKKNRIFLLGTLLLLALHMVDIYQPISGLNFFTSLGVLFLTSVTMMLNMSEITEMLGLAMKAKLIDKLAYTDGLTGVGNTTAFREKLDSLEVTKINYESIGIVQLDINNLKVVNDTLGHSVGDDLILVGSRVIKEAFGSIGEVYRIGGDEFAVIVTCDHAPQRCNEAAAKFENILEEYNSNPKARFKLQIAYGVAFYKHDYSGNDLFLREIQKQADVMMYNNKREIKQREKYKSELEAQQAQNGGSKNDDRDIIVMD